MQNDHHSLSKFMFIVIHAVSILQIRLFQSPMAERKQERRAENGFRYVGIFSPPLAHCMGDGY
jgi:hypothetical protein